MAGISRVTFPSGAKATIVWPQREFSIDGMNIEYESLPQFRSCLLREADGSLVGELDARGLDAAGERVRAGEDAEAVMRDLMATP